MSTSNVILLLGGGVLIIGTLLFITRRPAPSRPSAATGVALNGGSNTGQLVAGIGQGLSQIAGSIASEIERANQQTQAAGLEN